MNRQMNLTQANVWEHLTSGDGDTTLRQKALRMLSEDGFFTGYGGPQINEEGCMESLRTLMNTHRYCNAFCATGRERLLKAAQPPSQHEVVLTVRIPIKEGNGPGRVYRPDEGTYGHANHSIAKHVAGKVQNAITLHDLDTPVGHTNFALDLSRDVRVEPVGVEVS